jgi:hypothetical protein
MIPVPELARCNRKLRRAFLWTVSALRRYGPVYLDGWQVMDTIILLVGASLLMALVVMIDIWSS